MPTQQLPNSLPQYEYVNGQLVPKRTGSNNSLTNQYSLYNSGVAQNAQDYDTIMKGYGGLANSTSRPATMTAPSSSAAQASTSGYNPTQISNPNTYNPFSATTKTYDPAYYSATQSQGPNASAYRTSSYNPAQLGTTPTYTSQQMQGPGTITPERYQAAQTPYVQSEASKNSIANLANLAETGGYSEQGIADLRARGVSPIRAVYANAQRNVDRSRALAGGYSPNYNATTAKMAREMSDQIANQVTDVNAGIAQNVAGNKIAIAPSYSSAANQESDLANQMGMTNTAARNTAGQFNAEQANAAQLQNIANIMHTNEANTNAYNEAQKFNVGNTMQTNLFNAGSANEAGKFNTEAANNAQLQQIADQIRNNQFNATASNQANQFNAGNRTDANRTNAAAITDTNRFNTTNANTAQLENIANMMKTGMFNAGNANEAAKFNAGNANENARFNAGATNTQSQNNFENMFRTNTFNAGNQQQQIENLLKALQGMQGLYGTTPAMAQLFGDQANKSATLQNTITQQNRSSEADMINALLRGQRRG